MDWDINTSKYRCLGLSGYPASSSFISLVVVLLLFFSLSSFKRLKEKGKTSKMIDKSPRSLRIHFCYDTFEWFT